VQTHARGFDYPSIAEVECPFPTLSRIRADGSVHPVGENRFLVSHYHDVEHVLRREDLFTGCSEERLNPFDWPGPEGVPEYSLTSTGMVKNVIELDPPHHKHRRDRMFGLLKPARVRGYRPWIEEIVDELIDAFIDDGRVELMSQFAYPMPTQLIIRILGLSPDDFPWMHAWGIAEWKGGEQYLTDDMVEGQKPHILDAGPRITAEILKRVERPTDDGLSETIQAQIEEDGEFNLGIVRADLGQFVGAGITTTGHLVSSAMLTLVENPALMAEVRSDTAKLRNLLEESLRVDAPLQWIPRVARVDSDVGGVQIPKGSYLIVMIASANRDAAKWGDDAEDFCPHRANAIDHLSFGKGPHFCIGAPLGRLEAHIAFERLFARLENIRLAAGTQPAHLVSPTFRGLANLQLEFDRI
jgi:cytochrome P450